ncbi:substrate-binding periplasmic protein [Bowmanella dokdonensis]|uniref:Amino acid ABC transporter substrate-binding protein n=1 Tax=Bowmanella dokdonensis TaxID=751969 RepID=A0A939IQE5_9ALTE|nr:transporter substrate-binding domain-containing protein [Bowmanella dokdonensis]MBN7826860.1 amino acid ABC transporter substrate-binding protein [Bowmanella dokdonensis]
MRVVLLFLILLSANSVALPKALNCASDHFAPYVLELDGEIRGINIDLVKRAAAMLGIEMNFVLVPWKRLELDLEQKEFDCVVAYFRTREREAYMHFTQVPIQFTSYNLFVSQGRLKPGWSLEQLHGWRIAYHRGFLIPSQLTGLGAKGKIYLVPVQNDEQAMGMLHKGRIDALITNKAVGEHILRHNDWPGIEAVSPALSFTPAFLVFARTDELAPLVARFDEALFRLLYDGSYLEIKQRYQPD